MEYVSVVLRFLHIILGVIWVGAGVTTAWILHPLATKLQGENGSQIIRAWYSKSRFNQVMPIAAIGTTLAGIILWGLHADGSQLEGFSKTGSMVMGIGALFGILAFGHGIGLGRMSGKYADMVNSGEASEDELNEMEAKLARNGNISVILTLIAVACMSSARSLP
jgi:uncharacterized membrane protein